MKLNGKDIYLSFLKGDKGDANTLTIGTVEGGEVASATITGEAPNQVLNLILPKGDKGDTGEQGEQGEQGIVDDNVEIVAEKLLDGSGYIKYESGLIIQWFTCKPSSNTTVTLPTPFTTTNYSIGYTPISTDTSNILQMKVRSKTTTNFKALGMWCASNSAGTVSGDITFNCIAIGY